jgi:hypothetical protein
MPTPTEKQRQLYANLMHEVKVRIEAIDHAVLGRMNLSTVFVREFCWLQLRMLCELIALSCLVAHGDIAFLQPHKVGKSYSADDILDRLTALRQHFYPEAVRQIRAPAGSTEKFQIQGIQPSPLSKDSLLTLYGKTHRHLHRGSLKKLLSMDVRAPIDLTIDTSEVIGWAQKINDLLSSHVIAINANEVILCSLRNADANNDVQVAVAMAAEPHKS